MRYEKGTFTVVPNREALRGLAPATQTLYLWLCSYADEYGECYPSRSRLANDIGATTKTVDTHLKKLEDLGLITKTNRVEDNEKQSNLYQLQLVGGREKITLPRETVTLPLGKKLPHPREIITHRTITTELNPTELNINIYGEYQNVRLTAEDMERLKDQLGETVRDELIEELSGYIAQKGRNPYKNHRATIQKWARTRKEKQASKAKTFSFIG